MMKRILLAAALALSLGGAVVACNTPASTTTPTIAPVASSPAESAPAASESLPAASESAAPSAS
jgi:hypothetical protein